jgi:hypothetical protein
MRSATSWWLDHADGTVSLMILRRVGAAEGTWLKLEFHGQDEAAAEVLYDEYCAESYERSRRHHERRQNWGPREVAS